MWTLRLPMFLLLIVITMTFTAPVFAQVDFSGEWAPRFYEDQPERVPGPELADYLGIPINDDARMRADTWDASIQTLPEWQCRPHSGDYIWRGPSNLRIWKETDPVTRQITAFHAEWLRSVDNPIYLDGRQRPGDHQAHTWGGFATGKWDGDVLTVTVTHLKEGYLRRNGLPRSDLAKLTEHWIRHGDLLTVVTIVEDPVYLTEPFIRTTDYELNLHQQVVPYPCGIVEEVDRAKGAVPHHLPGTNLDLNEFANRHAIPFEATRGGAETMYPDYRMNLRGVDTGTVRNSGGGQQNRVPENENTEIVAVPIRGNVYMLAGAGGNITVSAGPDGVLLVDTGAAQMTAKVLSTIQQLQTQLATNGLPEWRWAAETRSTLQKMVSPTAPPKPIRYIINTHMDADHTGGNEKIAATGATMAGGNVAGTIADAGEGAAIIAHENVLNGMSQSSGNRPPAPFGALPTDTYHSEGMKLSHFFNGEAIQIFHKPAAHTDGDSIVFFRGSDVISAGDIFVTTGYPVIDIEKGGNVQGVIDGLNLILDLAIAEFRTEGGTMIVPGHGRLCDSADVAYYRDMVTIIRDRIQDLIRKGMTVEQVKAARPTRDYDRRYGSTKGSWTTDMFVEAVYQSLSPTK